MVEVGTGKHSPAAMLLSVICPGLGQLYLRKIKKGVLIFLVAAMGAFIIYVNSIPLNNFSDLWDFGTITKESYLIWQFKNNQLMFRPHWYFKMTGYIQFVVTWLYGIIDGWMGRRLYKPRKKEVTE